MRHKIKKAAALCLTLCLLSGCGKVQTENSTSGTEKLSSSAIPETDTASSSEIAQSNENFLNQTEEPRQTPVPRNASVSMKKPYSDSEREVSVLGLKEYKKLTGDFGTDKPGKGKCFLVLFLKIGNSGDEKDYINPYQVTAEVDGEELINTALINQPENYPTIFTNIEPGQTQKGTVVWEVPADWKKFKFTYTGWEGSDGLTLDAEFTPKKLKTPEKF